MHIQEPNFKTQTMKAKLLLITIFVACSLNAQTYTKSDPTTKAAVTAHNLEDVYEYAYPDVKPQFPGNFAALLRLIKAKIKPENITAAPSQKYRLVLKFVVEKNGHMTNARIELDPGYDVGKEALRAFAEITDTWQPAQLQGKPVRVWIKLPLTIEVP